MAALMSAAPAGGPYVVPLGRQAQASALPLTWNRIVKRK
jgi:hypothetical protein